ncbi:MAG: LysR family transcriptional regulator [Burkholderiales bacterium]|mgnify:CR=1 FL=1|nr:LysR family transcriptional regulator [Burkholderiales bacterium]OJX06579.1 MAG: hypothetical protein BGO72_16340 [Burkholderiales bacterium 70-64]
MELRQLRHAIVLAETGSFVEAAERLHITQPTLSRSIQSLEDELGTRLFDRGRHGARPTREGKLLVERADQVRLTLNGLRHEMDLSKKGELGEVRFGMGPLSAAIFMADVLTRLVNRYPGIEVRSSVNGAEQLRDALLAERIDFFVHTGRQIAPDPRIATERIGQLQLSLFVRAGHPLAGKRRVKEEDLRAYPFMAGSVPQSRRLLGPASYLLNAGFTCDDFQTLKVVVQRTDAIWLTSHAMVMQECRQGAIVELGMAGNATRFPADLVMTSLAGRRLSPTADLVIQMIRGLSANLGASIKAGGRSRSRPGATPSRKP